MFDFNLISWLIGFGVQLTFWLAFFASCVHFVFFFIRLLEVPFQAVHPFEYCLKVF